jgi:hypothetical protein
MAFRRAFVIPYFFLLFGVVFVRVPPPKGVFRLLPRQIQHKLESPRPYLLFIRPKIFFDGFHKNYSTVTDLAKFRG